MKKINYIFEELKEHIPFTATATLVSVLIMSLLLIKENLLPYASSLFHIFHPAHVFFSSIVSAAIFYNHRKKPMIAITSAVIISLFVGSVSDIIFPYLGSLLFNIQISFHLPVFEEPILIFGVSIAGAVFGVVTRTTRYPHFLHVLISVFASLLYIFAYSTEFSIIIIILIFLITSISVTIPCCLSDIVLPLLFQDRLGKKIKIIKFRKRLVKQILKKEKTSTWRLFDDKNFSEGDNISLVEWENGKEFAIAKIEKVIEKRFDELKFNDFVGHEKFKSDKEMYRTFSKYYKKEVGPKTKVKIIQFKLK